MEFISSKKKLLRKFCWIAVCTTSPFIYVMASWLVKGGFTTAFVWFCISILSLALPCFIYHINNVQLTFENMGIKCNKLHSCDLDGFVAWRHIKKAKHGSDKFSSYVDITLTDSFLMEKERNRKPYSIYLQSPNIAFNTDALEVSNKELASFINKRVNYRGSNSKGFNFSSVVRDLSNMDI